MNSSSAPPSTATPTHDPFMLGTTSGQRSAEIIAALRSVRVPTPVHIALVHPSSRLLARLLIRLMGRSAQMFNFIPTRQDAMTTLAKRFLPTMQPDALVVELAAGLAARGLALARTFPRLQVVEIDLPDVVQVKRERLRQAKIAVPDNLRWLGANLSTTPLSDILPAQAASLFISEGLFLYLSHRIIEELIGSLYMRLAPHGVLLVELMYRKPMQAIIANLGWAARLGRRQLGAFEGWFEDEQQAINMFTRVGYSQIQIHRLTQLADELQLPRPIPDVSFLLVAKKA